MRNALFWRRATFSSPLLVEKNLFLTTSPVLVTILRRESFYFGDEPRFRHHF
ncbi:hypothetical protein [Caldifermentibacillus hisashii]|uniref:hypothetical protein n=1 Tax=Caldifermentibacillus hisashii TaxID=996558 RepID=UPI0034D3CA58